MTTTVSSLFLALLVKPALIVSVAAIASRMLHKRSAAARHIVWANGLVLTLALPIIALAVPPLRIAQRTTVVAPQVVEAVRSSSSVMKSGQSQTALSPIVAASLATRPARDRELNSAASVMTAGWMLVVLCLVLRRVSAEAVAHGIVRRGSRPPSNIIQAATKLTTGMRFAPRMVLSTEVVSPVVIGIVRPTIVLPVDADQWAHHEFESVMIHELGHVDRRDCLLNFIADVASALYWCNALVWVAARRMKAESENACDDLVLRRGSVAETYAALLLRFAARQVNERVLPSAATAMARSGHLEVRLRALLNDTTSRAPLHRLAGIAYVIVGLLAALPASALTLHTRIIPPALRTAPDAVDVRDAPAPSGPRAVLAERTSRSSASTSKANAEPDQSGDSLSSVASERLAVTWSEEQTITGAASALTGPDSMLARRFVMALGKQPLHEGDLVAERAAWALTQTTNARLVEPLIEALVSDDWRTQAYAAWALATAQDARAVPSLVSLMKHTNWRLRAMVAYAIRESRSVSAATTMREALDDDAWQVRLQVVEYLADIGDTSQLPSLLQDRHVAVRNAARAALNHQ